MSQKFTWDDVEVAVVGSGTMGALLAQAFAQNGVAVVLIGRREESLRRAFFLIEKELEDAVKKCIFSSEQIDEIKNRIFSTTSYEQGLQGKNLQLAIETATEDLAVKKDIFQRLDQLCPPRTVLATNTSSLDADWLARQTSRPENVVWMHFFFPPHKNHAGEYAPTAKATPESLAIASKYMKLAKKDPSPLLKFRKGGAANIIFIGLLLEAARMVEEGVNPLNIELASKEAFSMPAGFLSMLSFIGMSLAYSCLKSFSDSSNPDDPFYRAYENFFTPPENPEAMSAAIKQSFPFPSGSQPEDFLALDIIKKRFWAVAFMTATEVVDSGIIAFEELEKLCRIAFQWPEGPFSIMNRVGIKDSFQLVTERMELSHRKEINFPVPRLLIEQAKRNEKWPLHVS